MLSWTEVSIIEALVQKASHPYAQIWSSFKKKLIPLVHH